MAYTDTQLRYIDLHTHSTCSDGTTTPAELINEAKKAGLSAISLTDHDTMAGVAEATKAGNELGIEVMPGVEFSANYEDRAVHILGYGLDQYHPGLLALVAELQEIRKSRNKQILTKLDKLGIFIDRNELSASSSGLIGRPHIARILVKQKVVLNMEQAFRKFLGKDGLAFANSAIFPATKTIKVIKEAGGLAILAHPTTFAKSLNKITVAIEYLRKNGLDGIETIYPGHSKKLCKELSIIAEKLELVITGGSDYHGPAKQGICIGGAPVMPPVPYGLLEKIRIRLTENHKKTDSP